MQDADEEETIGDWKAQFKENAHGWEWELWNMHRIPNSAAPKDSGSADTFEEAHERAKASADALGIDKDPGEDSSGHP